jgi:hypothetical protein
MIMSPSHHHAYVITYHVIMTVALCYHDSVLHDKMIIDVSHDIMLHDKMITLS